MPAPFFLFKSCLTSSKERRIFALNLQHGKTAKDAVCRGQVYPRRTAKVGAVEQVQRQAVVKGHSRPHRKRVGRVNFIRIPENLWPHLGKLSGLQVGILADVWTWQEQGKTAHRSNESLAQLFGVTGRAVTKAVKRLEELGLVEVSYGEKNLRHVKGLTPEALNTCSPLNERSPRTIVHPEQSFTPTLNDRSPLPRTTVHPPPEQSFTQIEHRIEHTEEPRKEQGPKKEKVEIVLPWDTPAFREAWATWLDERRQMGVKKYTPRGEQRALKNLLDVGGTEEVAIATINYSIAQSYQGLFPERIKNEQQKNSWRDRSKRELDPAKALEWANRKR